MGYRKTNLLVTLVFDENSDLAQQIDTELSLKNEMIKDLQDLVKNNEVKHFIVADDEIINNRLKPCIPEDSDTLLPKGKWIRRHYVTKDKTFDMCVCSNCSEEFSYDAETGLSMYQYGFCPNCRAEMESEGAK